MMEGKVRNRSMFLIVFELLIIFLGVGGITIATNKLLNNRSQTLIGTDEYGIDYIGDKEIVVKDLEPISDNLIDINTKDNVIRLEFSLRGVDANKEEDLIYDIMVKDINVDSSLRNEYTKWNLYKNGTLISNGSLDPKFDGDILGENMHLTNVQQDLPKYNKDYDKYVLIMWISESCDDITTCELIDQSNIVDSNISMEVFVALYGGAKKELERIPNYDSAGVSRPILYDNMIPVSYKDGNFVVSDKNNSDKDNVWYDYKKGFWANSVIVRSDKRNKYEMVGTVISNEDVLAYYVWIPRYSYKLWNVGNEIDDSYGAYDEGIDILFDVKNNNIENDKYILHPAFNDRTGFWVSKYEIGLKNTNYVFVGGVDSYKNDTLDNYKEIISNLVVDYSLGDKVNSGIISNLEWGAISYLSHSKYGVCEGDGCLSIGVNDTITSGNNKQDTTTRNVYGVYDMAGGCNEYVVGEYGIGAASSEVTLENGGTWYNGTKVSDGREYILRGGNSLGMFYYGDYSMGTPNISTRSVLTNK